MTPVKVLKYFNTVIVRTLVADSLGHYKHIQYAFVFLFIYTLLYYDHLNVTYMCFVSPQKS